MSQRTRFLSRLIGICAILVSLSVITRKQAAVEMLTAFVHDSPLLFIVSVMTVAAGLAIILSHNVWSGGALPVILTLIGWLMLIKGLVFLFLSPEAVFGVLLGCLHYRQLFYLYSAIPLVLGIYLTYAGGRSTEILDVKR